MALGSPVRRRSRDSGCQWLTIGMALGGGCSLVFCLALYVAGIIEIQGLSSEKPTAEAIITVSTAQVTATPEAATFTPQPLAVATEATTASIPTFTPTLDTTPLGSALTPTRLPETAGTETPLTLAAQADQAETEAIGTPVPASGSPTQTPAIGSGGGVPETLLTIASPLVEIPGGTFTMGTTREEGLAAVDACVTRDGANCTEAWISDSTPAHQVTIDDFQIEVTEVSVTQYVAFLNYLLQQNPGMRVDLIGCGGQPCALTTADQSNSIIRFNGTNYEVVNPNFYGSHPVFFVTWWGADAYCRAIGRRLPTEAEWERAARGPANSIYPWGPEWIPENANTSRSNLASPGPQPVDSFPTGASAYGVLNMAGNVSEWVWDYYRENYYSLPEAAGPNPRGPVTSDRRVIRGGGWDNVPLFARTVHRMANDPKQAIASLGFRCAADAGRQ